MGSEQMHEAAEDLSGGTREVHRAIASLMEELEAVDWYQQRVDATRDPELRAVLAHNRDEEIEHAAMVLEWLRRRVPALDRMLRKYLFSDGSITATEAVERDDATPAGETAVSADTVPGLIGVRPRPETE